MYPIGVPFGFCSGYGIYSKSMVFVCVLRQHVVVCHQFAILIADLVYMATAKHCVSPCTLVIAAGCCSLAMLASVFRTDASRVFMWRRRWRGASWSWSRVRTYPWMKRVRYVPREPMDVQPYIHRVVLCLFCAISLKGKMLWIPCTFDVDAVP